MDYFNYVDGRLCAEAVDLTDLAETYGTPLFVYSRATLERHWHAFDRALEGHPHLVCYAVKANANLALLNVLARLGSGFDIVSVGELERVLRAGGVPGKVVFSGVGKGRDEMARALEVGIGCFNVESLPELERLNQIAGQTGRRAPIALRINPDVDPQTHPYISTGLKENKFGIDIETARDVYRFAASLPHLKVIGAACHIGSQLTQVAPFVDALKRVLKLVEHLAADGIEIEQLDLGGGLGIRYRDETPPEPHEWARGLADSLRDAPQKIHVEPGRAIAGNAGVLLTRVEYIKHTPGKNFAVVDAAMNDLLRPALYDAWHEIWPVLSRPGQVARYDIVGPVCETADFLAKGRQLNLDAGDLLAVRSAGAYGFALSSNYNSRLRAAEVMVDGQVAHLARARETLDQLMAGEVLLPVCD